MKTPFKILLAILGAIIIYATLSSGIGYGRGSVDFFLGLALGIGLITTPFTAFGMLLLYILALVAIVGTPILGAYIGVQITGKDSIGIFIGLFAGGILGFKIATSDFFDTLLEPIRKISKLDDSN